MANPNRHTQHFPSDSNHLAPSDSVTTKRNLASWWSQFKERTSKKEPESAAPTAPPTSIFGVPLADSIKYANVAISLSDENGNSFTYGYVPIIVAKCGVYLKEKATETSGIFRTGTSERRVKELQALFDAPPRYGKGLDWTGYTVHDCAHVLRRYINKLPEPIVPFEMYDKFRAPIRGHQQAAAGELPYQDPDKGEFNENKTVKIFQKLITQLPAFNRQFLLYLLDMLAVFAAKSDVNWMPPDNLATIFQPGILRHPSHDMDPKEYRLNQDVLIFLIKKQDYFLVGMPGTEADHSTHQQVASATASPTKATAVEGDNTEDPPSHHDVNNENFSSPPSRSNSNSNKRTSKFFSKISRSNSGNSRKSKDEKRNETKGEPSQVVQDDQVPTLPDVESRGSTADGKNNLQVGAATTTSNGKPVGRSNSTSSARFSGVRRNISIRSSRSRKSNQNSPGNGPTPPTADSPRGTGAIGVQRSNTVPSKKSASSPRTNSRRFSKEKSSDAAGSTHVPMAATTTTVPQQSPQPERMSPHLRPVQPTRTPSRERTFTSIFNRHGPPSESDKSKPNKLRKKRLEQGSSSAAGGSPMSPRAESETEQ